MSEKDLFFLWSAIVLYTALSALRLAFKARVLELPVRVVELPVFLPSFESPVSLAALPRRFALVV